VSRERKIDIAVALVGLATSVAVMYLHGFGTPDPDVRDGDLLGVALLAGINLPLVERRRHPFAVFAASVAATVGIHALGYPGELGLWPALAVYSLAAHAHDERAARIGGLAAGASFAILGAIAVVVDPDPGIAFGAVAWAGAWVIGDVTRQRRARIAELADRAERAEREAARERRLAAAEERARIARELHDSAGHAINVILVQAGAARLLHASDPDASRRAIATIEDVARASIGEIDRLVRALRDDDARGGDLAPLPGTVEIDRLVNDHRANGLRVALRREGTERQHGTAVDRATYRIVQEALTNAARHGDGSADVVLRHREDQLEIVVTNGVAADGHEVAEGGRHGLIGMRERAALLGGRLDAGGENGTFCVHATLPYGDTST
jgi:signal transduction histidine kinase